MQTRRLSRLAFGVLPLACSVLGSQLVGCAAPTGDDDSRVTEDAIAAKGATDPDHPGWLAGDTKRRAEALTSLFENNTTEIQYAYVENIGDGRGFTAGRAGFTTANGDALDVITLYTTRVPNNPLAKYLPRLRTLVKTESGSVVGLSGYDTAWKTAAKDAAFRAAQDEIKDRLYFTPAMKRSDLLNLQTALAKAAVYDAIIQHGEGDDPDGLPALLSATAKKAGGTPATGIDEKKWLDTFFTVRRADLAHSVDTDSRSVWAESVGRVDVQRVIAKSDNYDLHGPIVIHTGDFNGTVK